MKADAGFRAALQALGAAARSIFPPRRKLPVTQLDTLFHSLPPTFKISLADVGSIGGLHQRWSALGDHLETIGFDPLDERGSGRREHIFPVLLSDRDGDGQLHITRRGSMSSTLRPNAALFRHFWDKPEHIEIVETRAAHATTLDTLGESDGIAPDALKIDVQGGEGAVLTGAARTLQSSIILAEIECSFFERYAGQPTFDQVLAAMRGHGFALLDLRRLKRYRFANCYKVRDPSLGRGMRAGRLAFCDAIFMLEPELLWQRIEQAGDAGGMIGLKAVVLLLIYGKADLAAATYARVRTAIPKESAAAFDRFFRSLAGDGGSIQQLHRVFDRWAQRV